MFQDTTNALQSYLATGLGFLSDANWMVIGAAVLLVARLIQDVPKALETILHYRKQGKKDDKSN